MSNGTFMGVSRSSPSIVHESAKKNFVRRLLEQRTTSTNARICANDSHCMMSFTNLIRFGRPSLNDQVSDQFAIPFHLVEMRASQKRIKFT